MATDKETVILDFQIEQGDAIAELERTKKVILDLKKEQDNLNKAYKAGTITQEEYVSELVRVESVMKKTQATYNNTQKSVTGVKTSMDKLNESIKNSSQNITIAGTNVGQLGQKLTALANPVTATVAVIGALGAAYARSTVGARDLEFASNQLSSAITITTNSFASLITSSEDGEGFLSTLTSAILFKVSPALALMARNAALAQEKIEDLSRNEIIARGEANERLAENQELMTSIQDSQTDINEKLHQSSEIIKNLRTNEAELLEIKEQQLKEINNQLAADTTNEKILDAQALKMQEISVIKKDTERKVQGILKLESNLLDAENKKAEANRKQREETEKKIKAQDDSAARELAGRQVSFDDDPTGASLDPQEQFERDADLINAELGLVRTAEQEKQTLALQTNAIKQSIHDEDMRRLQEGLQGAEDNFNQLANLFSDGSEARKLFALLGIGADTASAIASLTASSEANPANAFTFGGAGIAQYAAGIIRILGNIAAAKNFLGGSFAGGGDFVTTKPTMLLVGDNPGGRERVTVEPLSGKGKTTYNPRSGIMAMAGGGSLTFDGAKETAVQTVQQSLMIANSIKRMPRPIVGVKQIAEEMNRVEVKQNVSKA